jgi:hypothetical protein
LKRNLRANTSDQYIRYSPINWSEIDKITKLDVKKDIEVIKEVHSMVTYNEIKANAFALYEAYYRGALYFKLKSKFSDNKAFIDYCDESFNIPTITVLMLIICVKIFHLFFCLVLALISFINIVN